MNRCNSCVYWTQHNMGDCSQNMITTEGIFVKCRTVGTYGCNSYKIDFKKFCITARTDDKGDVSISGIMNKDFLEKVIEKCNEKIKELK